MPKQNQVSDYWERFLGYAKKRKEALVRWYRQQNKWRLAFWTAFIGVGAVLLFVLTLILLTYWGAFGALPDYASLKDIQNQEASEVYADDGVLLGKYYIENRTLADFDEIPSHLIEALVATEDARFFEHRGIDLRALGRVLVKSILLQDEASGGGSTISQQLAKNIFPRRRYRFLGLPINKIRELFTARRLEQLYTKEELLRLYLNTVPFGGNAFGVKVASRRFFNTAPEKLKVEEAALLVGMLKANTRYNPKRHPEQAQERRNTVLARMATQAYITPEVRDSLQQLPIQLDYVEERHDKGLATYFREHIRQEVGRLLKDHQKEDGSAYNLYTDGLKIYTTLDSRLQRHAEAAVADELPKIQAAFDQDWKGKKRPWEKGSWMQRAIESSQAYQQFKKAGKRGEALDKAMATSRNTRIYRPGKGYEVAEMSPRDSVLYHEALLRAGLLAVEPGTGLIKAWVGGADISLHQYDQVKARRQAGSTFKPMVYATALRSGMRPCEYTENRLVTYSEFDDWQPRNADGKYEGVYSMAGGLQKSVNTISAALIQRTGVAPVYELAQAMGVESELPEKAAIALGAADVSMLDLARVYSTFANRGKRPTLHYLDRIEDANGKVIIEFERPRPATFPEVLERSTVDMMVKMLEGVVDGGTAGRLRSTYGLTGALAGKTGTTQNQADGWFAGFTPRIVAVSWVGAASPDIHFRSLSRGQGGATALPIWGRFLRSTYKDAKYKSWRYAAFPAPADTIVDLMQCPPYLDEMPILADYWAEDLPDPELLELMTDNDEDELFRKPMRRPNESNADYARRVEKAFQRYIKKRKRRERRKNEWSKRLFGN